MTTYATLVSVLDRAANRAAEGRVKVPGETASQKRKRLIKRDLCRKTVCSGCHYNYYNFPTTGNGWDAPVAEDYSCWYLDRVKRGRCPLKHQ